MAKMSLTIEVVEITRKGEHIGYKVYVNDFVHGTKLPRKPGDLDTQRMKELADMYEQDGAKFTADEIRKRLSQPGKEPIDYYTSSLVESIQQALVDWQIWKEQGHKRADA